MRAPEIPGLPQKNMEEYDKERIYCRKLGHWLTFDYCRQEKDGLPCPRIRDCWFERIPINKFLKENYKEEKISYVFEPSGSKVKSLIELIEEAKKRNA